MVGTLLGPEATPVGVCLGWPGLPGCHTAVCVTGLVVSGAVVRGVVFENCTVVASIFVLSY